MKRTLALILAVTGLSLPAPAVQITCIGDSFTLGGGAPNFYDDASLTFGVTSYPAQLAALLPADTITNRGTGGWSSSFIRGDFVDNATAGQKAGIVICGLGTNDFNQTNATLVGDQVQLILDAMTSSPKRLILWPPFSGTTFTIQQRANIAAIRAHLASRFPSYFMEMWDYQTNSEGVINESSRRYNAAGGARDTLHPNSMFYAEVASRAYARMLANGWVTAAGVTTAVQSFTFEPSKDRLRLLKVLSTGARSQALTTRTALSTASKTDLDAAVAHVNTKKTASETLAHVEIFGAGAGSGRYVEALATFVSAAGGRVVRVTDFSASNLTDIRDLFTALEAL